MEGEEISNTFKQKVKIQLDLKKEWGLDVFSLIVQISNEYQLYEKHCNMN